MGDLSDQIDNQQSLLHRLNEQVTTANTTLENMKAQIKSLEIERLNAAKRVDEIIYGAKADADKIVSDAKSKADAMLSAADETKKAADDGTAALATAKADFDVQCANLSSLKEAHSKAVEDFNSDRFASETNLRNRSNELNALETKLTAALKDVEAQKVDLDNRQSVIGNRERSQTDSQALLSAAQENLRKDQDAIVEKIHQVAADRAEVNRIKSENDSMSALLQAQKIENDKQSQDNANRLRDLEEREAAASKKEDDIKSRSAALDAQEKLNNERAQTNAETIQLIAVKNRELDQKIKTLNDLRSSKA